MTGLSSSCGACKFLRRKCTSECVFAPYFSYDQAANHFAAVHKVFGASNVSKLLLHLPVQARGDAAVTVSYEALARMRDPVYGCVGHIFALQEQVANLQEEIEILGAQMANLGILSCGGISAMNTDNHDCNFDSSAGSNFQNIDPMALQFFYQDSTFPCVGINAPDSRCTEDSLSNAVENNDSSMFPPIYGGAEEGMDWFCDGTDPRMLERLLDGADHEILAMYPWLSNIGNV